MTESKNSKNLKGRFKIGSTYVEPGERKKALIDAASLYDYTRLSIPVEVIRGKIDGPVLFISAAIHGDEINGVEIIKRLLQKKVLSKIKGTLIAIPIVNVFGFNNKSRYLPDRRDLNRSFPGRLDGSLASSLACTFMKEIVKKCSHGIDLHTGAIHRTNLPQIRACLDDAETHKLAQSFGVPVIINSNLRDGSLRYAARKKNVKTLLFEGGEALRFEDNVIKAGVAGCLSVMRGIGMLPELKLDATSSKKKKQVFTANLSYWVRASHGGTFRLQKSLGDYVQRNEVIATISDPFGEEPYEVVAEKAGIIIGLSRIPLVNRGDAIAHIASFDNSKRVHQAIEIFDDELSS